MQNKKQSVPAILDMMLADTLAINTILIESDTFEIVYYINGKDYIFSPLPSMGTQRSLLLTHNRPLDISPAIMETFTRVQEQWAGVLDLLYNLDQVIYHHWVTEYCKIKGWRKDTFPVEIY